MFRMIERLRSWWLVGRRQSAPCRRTPGRVSDNPPDNSRGFIFEDPRDQMDMNEFLEAEQSRTERSFEIREIASWTSKGRTIRSLTPCGFLTKKQKILLQTTSGQIVKQEQLVSGGKCAVCHGYTDREHFFVCAVCGRGVCRLHMHPLEGMRLCPDHARQALYNLDTWAEGEKERLRP